MTEPTPASEPPEARFLTEDRTSVLPDYPRECPRCGQALPVTRARFPLRLSPKSVLLLTCGYTLAAVWVATLILPVVMLLSGITWIPGLSMVDKALSLRREYQITCEHCGFSFRVDEPAYE